jgi:hypothetical protein
MQFLASNCEVLQSLKVLLIVVYMPHVNLGIVLPPKSMVILHHIGFWTLYQLFLVVLRVIWGEIMHILIHNLMSINLKVFEKT